MTTCFICCEELCNQGVSGRGLVRPGMMEVLRSPRRLLYWPMWRYAWHPRWWRHDGTRQWYSQWWSRAGDRRWNPSFWRHSRSYSGKRCWQYFLHGFDGLKLFIPNWERRCLSWISEILRQILYWLACGIARWQFWDWAFMREEFNCIDYTICTCGWDIYGVPSVVLRGWSPIPPFHTILCERALFGGSLKYEHLCYQGQHGGAVEIEVPV